MHSKNTTQENPTFLAVIPAAGESRRMGTAKLMLPWHSELQAGCEFVVDGVVRQLLSLGVQVRLVCRVEDRPLRNHCRELGATVVPTQQTLDMKQSIQLGVKSLQDERQPPKAADWCFLMPADLPTLRIDLLKSAMEFARLQPPGELAVTPEFQGKRKHPTLLKWKVVPRVFDIPADRGLNWLLNEIGPSTFGIPPDWVARDVDTPDQYQRELNAKLEN